MHRLFGLVMGLFFSLVAAGGYLAFDYWNVNRMSRMGDGDGVSNRPRRQKRAGR